MGHAERTNRDYPTSCLMSAFRERLGGHALSLLVVVLLLLAGR